MNTGELAIETMAPINKKLHILNQIYAMYDQFTATLDMACEKYCATCCTCNVTLTTLEAYPIALHIRAEKKTGMLQRLASLSNARRFRPTITTNRLACLCMEGKPVPEEESDPSWGKCPFLSRDACTIYSIRPFGCRCLLSSQRCRTGGSAQITPFVLTVNTVFMQVIEHVDQNGRTGNLVDLTTWLSQDTHRRNYESNELSGENSGLIANWPMPGLMIPEEHREALKDILIALQRIE